MADLVERIVEINRRVWDEWPVGIDAGNVEEVRRAAATAVAAALEAEASERERRGLEQALVAIGYCGAASGPDEPWHDQHDMGVSKCYDAVRALIPEAPVREGE